MEAIDTVFPVRYSSDSYVEFMDRSTLQTHTIYFTDGAENILKQQDL
jgi:hypothetical protein